MGLVRFSTYGNFNKTYRFLEKLKALDVESLLKPYGEEGCRVLESNTPVRTGATAAAWSYKIKHAADSVSLEWHNSRLADDEKTPLVVLIINGHGTGRGGYVPPNDFVTPAIRAVCEEAANAVWKAVTS